MTTPNEEFERYARDRDGFLAARLAEYADVIVSPRVMGGVYQADAAVFYRPAELLTADADAVRAASAQANLPVDYEVEEVESLGIQRLRIGGDVDPARITKVIARTLPRDVGAAPHHVLSPAQIHSVGPGTDPLPCADLPPLRGLGKGGEIGVVVTDTGFFDHYPTRSDLADLVQATSIVDGDDEERIDVDGDGVVDGRTAAHGGFIGGVIQSHLPETPMSMQRAVGDDGLMDEISVALATIDGLRVDGMGVVNLSLGTYVHGHGDLVGLRAAVDRILARRPDVLLVCAAGNDATDDRWYPAAWAGHRDYADAVVSVGALDTTGPRPRTAAFSNRGAWVTAWAPGVDIRSIYPTGVEYEYHGTSGPVGTLDFDGRAMWSGTSFAAPYAAAVILAHATREGMSPREAWADIRRGSSFVVF